MKAGAENRKKTIIAGALIAVLLVCVYSIYTQVFGGDSTAPAPATSSSGSGDAATGDAADTTAPHKTASSNSNAPALGTAAGVDATKLASTSSSLDPTLDETAMLRTEGLVYSGTGRNIFSASSTAPASMIPKAAPSAYIHAPVGPVIPVVPPAPPTCPPTCPPINLKFFGTATRSNGLRQAFVLDGEDVYLASPGEIVARKYKIVSVSANSIQVEDLLNKNTQTLPLSTN